MRKIVITGGTGYLGGFLIARLLAAFPDLEVVSFARRPHEVFEGAPRFSSLLFGGQPDGQAFAAIEQLAPDAIIHAAALASAAECEREPHLAERVNVDLSRSVAECAGRIGAAAVYVSTDLVFDGAGPKPGGFAEEDPPHPCSVYSRTKLAAERYFLGLPRGSVGRLSLVYGPPIGSRQGPLGWMTDSFRGGRPMTLFLDELRTPLHVEDAAAALCGIATRGLYGLFHLGGPDSINRVELGSIIAQELSYDPGLIVSRLRADAPSSPPRPENVSLDSRRAWRMLGFEPHGVREGIRALRGAQG